jgi:hypothetical protein
VVGSSGKVSSDGKLDHPAMPHSMRIMGSMVIDVDGPVLKAKFIKSDGSQPDSFEIQKAPVEVAKPTFSPASGAYPGPTYTVKMSTTTSGASIRYATAGQDPKTSGTIGDTITISGDTEVAAYAFKAGLPDSEIVYASYNVLPPQVAKPVFNPADKSSPTALNVAITCATPDSEIFYGFDSDPVITRYVGEVQVNKTSTLNAFAKKQGMADSEFASSRYSIGIVELFNETFDTYNAGSNPPSPWTVTTSSSSTTAKVVAFPTAANAANKSVRFTDTSSSGSSSITRTISALRTGDVILQFSFQAASSIDFCKFYIQDGSQKALEMYTKNSNLVYRPPGTQTDSSADVVVAPFTANTWTKVKAVVHIASKTVDIYVNDELKKSAVPFRSPTAAGVTSFVFGTGVSSKASSSSTYVLSIDDVRVDTQ